MNFGKSKFFMGAVATAVAAATLTPLAATGAGAAEELQSGDGTTSSTAGASCWGIKTDHPDSADGVYYLNNAAMEAPQQYYCDMTTDGGGWVLVARGRDGWKFDTDGQGSRRTLREVTDGPEAFDPIELPATEIDALMNDEPVENLADGVRLRRATNLDGTNRQEIRWDFKNPTGNWSWSMDAGNLLDTITVDGDTFNKSNTRDSRSNWAGWGRGLSANDERRVWTQVRRQHGWQGGFALGDKYQGTDDRIRGDQDPNSYLWENGSERYPLGFTQMFIRPQITNGDAGFTPLPEEGLGEETNPLTLKDRAEFQPWGVVGINRDGETRVEPWKTNALSMRIVGDTVFIGGRFTGVQNGPDADPIAQPFLAAFDKNTGEWIDSFRPTLDGRVWSIEVTAQGKLLIGGDFTEVNGNPDTTALAALDPATGEVDTSFKGDIERIDSTDERAVVRDIEINGNDVYAAGSFTHYTGGTWNQIRVTKAVKLDATDGTPQSNWKPSPNGTVITMDTTPGGDRVYLGGYFSALQGDEEKGFFAGVDAINGNAIPGHEAFVPSGGSKAKYQQAVLVHGDHVFVGGSEHNVQKYTLDTNTLVEAHVTKQGGDTQAYTVFNDDLYMACHCADAVYIDTNEWRTPRGMLRTDSINLAGAFDIETWDYKREWNPRSLKGQYGEGPWGFDEADGCLWMVGDFNRSGWSGDAAQDWLGGFTHFCAEDNNAPSAPSDVAVALDGNTATVSFTPGADADSGVQHWVYRNDRVVGVAWSETFVDPYVAGPARYTVRAVDDFGNKSATADIVSVVAESAVLGTLVPAGGEWSYLDDGVQVDANWGATWFDDSTWATGAAPMGWNEAHATIIGATKPVTSYFRHDFVADPAGVGSLELRLRRDDGAVAYLNGTEIARSNMPGGAVDATTLAAGYAWGADETTYHSFTVPAALLNAGDNVLTVEVHQASAGNGDATFDAELLARAGNGDAVAPSSVTLSAAGGLGEINLDWSEASDDFLAGYIVRKDGAAVAVVDAATTTWVDGGLGGGVSHGYEVQAFDASGNISFSNWAGATTTADPAILAMGSEWAFNYDGIDPGADWASEGFDDAAWARGAGELGYGDSDEATVIPHGGTPRPLVAYFRTTVDVANPAAFTNVLFEAVRDDGIAIYVNGVEIGRDNLPAVELTNDTPAASGFWDRPTETTPVPIVAPSSAFHAGTNTIAVSVHNANAWSGDLSFDLSATGTF